MARGSAWAAAALLLGAGCSSGASHETNPPPDMDAGADATATVILDAGDKPAVPPDGSAECPSGVCNYQTGAGCTGATSCLPALTDAGVIPACDPAGDKANGAACTQANDCVAGHICVGGACRKLCCGGDWTACDSANEHCVVTLSYAGPNGGTLITGAMVCIPVNTCDALAPSTCGAGMSCQIVDATGATACAAEGSGGSGEPCPCKGGFTCVLAPSGPTCVRLCRAIKGGGAPFCEANEGFCTHYTRDPAGVGECAPPG